MCLSLIEMASKLKREMRRLTNAKDRWQEIKSTVAAKLGQTRVPAAAMKKFKVKEKERTKALSHTLYLLYLSEWMSVCISFH